MCSKRLFANNYSHIKSGVQRNQSVKFDKNLTLVSISDE